MATGFQFVGSLGVAEDRKLLYFIIDNSDTIQIGDAIMLNTDGHAVVATATEEILGIAAGVVDTNGASVTADSGTTDTYTVESDNETDKMWKVAVDVSKDSLYTNTVTGTTIATTNLLQFFDLSDENTINASSASDTTGQMQLIKVNSTTEGVFRIAESQLDPYAQD